MMTVPVSSILVQLHPDGRAAARSDGNRDRQDSSHSENLASLMQEAYRKGLEEGRTAALAESETMHAAEMARHEAASAERMRLMASRLEARLDEGLDSVRHAVCDGVAQVLRPVVERSMQNEMLDIALSQLGTIITQDQILEILIEAPEAYHAAIGELLDGGKHRVVLKNSGDMDIHVRIDQTLFETRLGDWLAELESKQ